MRMGKIKITSLLGAHGIMVLLLHRFPTYGEVR